MRCTRCDRIAIPQAVGRTRAGLVVFGWCVDCLAEEGCTLVETDEPLFGVARRTSRRRRPAPPRPAADRRRFAYFVVGGMAAWTLTLVVLGLVSLSMPVNGPPSALGNGTGQMLIAGGLLMGATGLAIWAATLDRRYTRRIAPRAVQAASTLVAFLILAGGIARHDPRRDPWVVGMAAVALGVSWWARRAGRATAPRKERDRKSYERI